MVDTLTARPGQRWNPDNLAPCGTEAAARRHQRRKEPLDHACEVAQRDARRQRHAWQGSVGYDPDMRPVRNGIPDVPYAYRARRYPWAERLLARAEAVYGRPANEAT